MITSQPSSSTRRRRTLVAAVTTLLAAALLGPSAALADSIAYLYLEEGRASCPSSAGDAGDAGMALMDSVTHYYPSVPLTEMVSWLPSAEGEYLLCGYIHRGSATVRVPMTTAQRRELRARLLAGERVRVFSGV